MKHAAAIVTATLVLLGTAGHGALAQPRTPSLSAEEPPVDVEAGRTDSKRCVACHDFEATGRHRIGPNLYAIVGAPVASREGYVYSAAMLALAAEGAVWTPDRLDRYLARPRDEVPGTSMAFAGMTDAARRADLIAYMMTLGGDVPQAAGAGPRR